AGEVFGLALRRAAAAPQLGVALGGAAALRRRRLLHHLVQVSRQPLLVGEGRRRRQLLGRQPRQLGVLQQEKLLVGREPPRRRGAQQAGGEELSVQDVGRVVRGVQVVEVVEGAGGGRHGPRLVDDLWLDEPAAGLAQGELCLAADAAVGFAEPRAAPQAALPQLRVVEESLGGHLVAQRRDGDHAGQGRAQAQRFLARLRLRPRPAVPLLEGWLGLRRLGHDPLDGEGQGLGGVSGGGPAVVPGAGGRHDRLQRPRARHVAPPCGNLV
ncbi:hypothetical protein FQV17_0009341, partial [Megadyptes antipodes antipodes]